MPFTFAHPAAVLPIHSRWKRWLALSPLAVGSMMPDASYYLPIPEYYKQYAHTVLGAMTFSIPIGLVLLAVFYWLATDVAYLLPSPHRQALITAIRVPAVSGRHLLLAACCIAIGAETHVFWDSFTHTDGWFVRHMAFLRVRFLGGRYEVNFVLQVLSSVAGLLVLFYVYDRWARVRGYRAWTVDQFTWRTLLWLGVLGVCAALAIVESHAVRGVVDYPVAHRRHFVLVLMTSFVRDGFIAVCALGLGMKMFRSRSRLDVAY